MDKQENLNKNSQAKTTKKDMTKADITKKVSQNKVTKKDTTKEVSQDKITKEDTMQEVSQKTKPKTVRSETVMEQLSTIIKNKDQGIKSMFNIIEDQDNNINYFVDSYEDKGHIAELVVKTLLAIFKKDPIFRHEFILKLAQAEPALDTEVAAIANENAQINSTDDIQNVITENFNILRNLTHATGLLISICNSDPNTIDHDTNVPVITTFDGSAKVLAYEVNNIINQFNGQADANGQIGAFPIENHSQFIHDFVETLEDLQTPNIHHEEIKNDEIKKEDKDQLGHVQFNNPDLASD